ncbi:MAG: HvfB family MNIO-type RiPP peptide maturase, partial [Gammaproteobacteria bacterium]
MRQYPVLGKGLGLRRSLLRSLEPGSAGPVDFMEVAPENWIDVGGRFGRRFREFTEQLPFVCHGLSLNLGGSAPLDEPFIVRIRQFLDEHRIRCYSEHLSYCGDHGHLYDLMPIPFTDDAVRYVAKRIRKTQELLERRIAIENVSYYCAPGAQMSEIDFIRAVLDEADCDLLLDINNIYVNSVNHRYDPIDFLHALPAGRVAYAHIAGHYNEAADLIIDTHGADIIEPVWSLLDAAYERFGVFPTLLERDFNLPPVAALHAEVRRIGDAQARFGETRDAAAT